MWSGLITSNQCGQSPASFQAVLGRGVEKRLGRFHYAAADREARETTPEERMG